MKMKIKGHLAISVKYFDMITETTFGISKGVGNAIFYGINSFVHGNHIDTMMKFIGVKIRIFSMTSKLSDAIGFCSSSGAKAIYRINSTHWPSMLI